MTRRRHSFHLKDVNGALALAAVSAPISLPSLLPQCNHLCLQMTPCIMKWLPNQVPMAQHTDEAIQHLLLL